MVGEAMTFALSGITIADFSRVLAGPYATMMLADLGATVIKVERAGTGDETRGWGPPFDSSGRATYFQSVNRNKESISLDLDKPDHQRRARELILESDVVVENFGYGGMKKFGLDYSALSSLKPKLIYCSITGFGASEKARELLSRPHRLDGVVVHGEKRGREIGYPTANLEQLVGKGEFIFQAFPLKFSVPVLTPTLKPGLTV
ncbi:MAG: hypothetical protein EBZ66_03085 [Actinobacteria bacterium]|nr:hypothetical protein [Actinomycetota bacterium]